MICVFKIVVIMFLGYPVVSRPKRKLFVGYDEMMLFGNIGVIWNAFEMLYVHVFLVSPLGVRHVQVRLQISGPK